MSRITAMIVVVGLAFALPVAAYAQQLTTVGAILDKGGKKLTKEEVLKLYTGSTVSGIQDGSHPDITFKNTNSTNGSVSGDAWRKGVWFTKVSGTWSMNDLGQICTDLRNDHGDQVGRCSYIYSVGGRYYSAKTDDKSAPVDERQFTR